jgi:hypothetical protein
MGCAGRSRPRLCADSSQRRAAAGEGLLKCGRPRRRENPVSEAESSVGQPDQLQLDNVELNSNLNQNLAINGCAEPVSISPIAPLPSSSTFGAADPANPVAIPQSVPRLSPQSSDEAAPKFEEVQSSVKHVRVDFQGDLIRRSSSTTFTARTRSSSIAICTLRAATLNSSLSAVRSARFRCLRASCNLPPNNFFSMLPRNAKNQSCRKMSSTSRS